MPSQYTQRHTTHCGCTKHGQYDQIICEKNELFSLLRSYELVFTI